MNKIIISGNLTRDPDFNETSSGKSVARMSIAVNRQYCKDNTVDFFNLTAWNKTAEICAKYLHKGSKVIVEGKLQTNQYDDKDGNRRIAYDIVIDQIEFIGSKKDADGAPPFDDSVPF